MQTRAPDDDDDDDDSCGPVSVVTILMFPSPITNIATLSLVMMVMSLGGDD